MVHVDGELIPRAVRGDHEALSRLLEACAPQVSASLRVRLGARWRAALDLEDVMQVTFMEAFLHIETCHAHAMGEFAVWLTRIAEHNLCDAIRELERARLHIPAADPGANDDSSTILFNLLVAPGSGPGAQAGRDEIAALLEAALQRLPPRYEQVVRLCELEGRPVDEVARRIDRSKGAVFMLRARAHERLRELMGAESHFFSNGE